MKRKRKKARGGDDPARLAFVRTLPCCMAWEVGHPTLCAGAVEAHHPVGLRWGKGMGTKSPDACAIPLCYRHHHLFHMDAKVGGHESDAHKREWQDYHVERVMEIPTCK